MYQLTISLSEETVQQITKLATQEAVPINTWIAKTLEHRLAQFGKASTRPAHSPDYPAFLNGLSVRAKNVVMDAGIASFDALSSYIREQPKAFRALPNCGITVLHEVIEWVTKQSH